MAKKNVPVPADSGGSDDVLSTIKGVLTICIVVGVGLYMSYHAGSNVSDKVLKQVGKERKKNEKEKRREEKERKKEEKRQFKLEMLKLKYKKH